MRFDSYPPCPDDLFGAILYALGDACTSTLKDPIQEITVIRIITYRLTSGFCCEVLLHPTLLNPVFLHIHL